jgi:hypothetical protein
MQTLNSIAREVNRRLGLTDDSTVGKSIAASASAGAKIPLTEIGGKLAKEGHHLDQERLQSAYDHARKAVQTSQLTEATTLVKEFRSSEAYQWARGTRVAGTLSFDSAYRESLDHQTTSEQSQTRAKELARVAQFMREWSNGAQTDFTNFAARRLSERGLLREEDPIRLQRAVTEIAYAYAKGGVVGSQFISADSPIQPTPSPGQLLGWESTPIRADNVPGNNTANAAMLGAAMQKNNKTVRDQQSRSGVHPSQAIANDVTSSTRTMKQTATQAIESGRDQVLQSQGQLSVDYNSRVNVGEVNRNHGANPAVWDTVGVQTDNRASVGEPPAKSATPQRGSEARIPPPPKP